MSTSHDFSVNTRQSKVAILLLIWKFYKLAFRQFLALIAVLAVGISKSSMIALWGLFIAISVLVIVMALLSYYRFYFRIEDDELWIQKGVFKKSNINIPFSRIQTVNFEQNILLQIFQNVKVEIDTAGSSKKEFSFDALKQPVANELREIILERKKIQAPVAVDDDSEKEALEWEELEDSENHTIFQLSGGQLLKIGLTENHLRAGLWMIAVAGYLFSTANEVGFKVEDRIKDLEVFEQFNPGLITALSFIPALILILILVSIVRTYLRYYGLSFDRLTNGFKIYSGLINRKEFSAPDNKIQKVAWGDNPLRRIFGIFVLWLKQARSADSDRNRSMSIPIITEDYIQQTLRHLYGDEMDKPSFEHPTSKHFFYRNLIYFIGIPAAIICTAGVYFKLYIILAIGVIYFLYFSITTYIQYRKSRFSFNDFMVLRKKGIYGNYREIIPWYKVQAVDIVQGIYQRRYSLANLILHTAAGEMKIPYLDLGQAQKLRDYALFHAETSDKEWM